MTATSKPIQHRDGCTARPTRMRVLDTRVVCGDCGRYQPRTDVPDTPCVDCGQPCRADVPRCTKCFRTHRQHTGPSTTTAPTTTTPTLRLVPTQTRLVCRVCYGPVTRKGVCRAC